MSHIRNLDHIETEIKEVLKYMRRWPNDHDYLENRLDNLRDFVIAARNLIEDDHR